MSPRGHIIFPPDALPIRYHEIPVDRILPSYWYNPSGERDEQMHFPEESIEREIIEKSLVFARQQMKNLRSSHGWDHVQRVLALAERIAKAEGADPFIVTVASILHDIAREDENRSAGSLCHARLGSERAYSFLIDCGLDERRAQHIARCIREHRFRNSEKPSTLESMVLFDADKLDSIGAIGIGRAFLFSGEVGAKLHNSDIDILSTKAYTEEDTAYREYAVKLQYIRDRIMTAEGRRLAEERTEFMTAFFRRLQEESSGRK